jgi:hypothetical protein
MFSSQVHNLSLVSLYVDCFLPDTPEENAWPVVAEAKDVAKWGARSAGCAAGFDIGRNDAARPGLIEPAYPF